MEIMSFWLGFSAMPYAAFLMVSMIYSSNFSPHVEVGTAVDPLPSFVSINLVLPFLQNRGLGRGCIKAERQHYEILQYTHTHIASTWVVLSILIVGGTNAVESSAKACHLGTIRGQAGF